MSKYKTIQIDEHLLLIDLKSDIINNDWCVADYITGFTYLDGTPSKEGKLYLVQANNITLGNVEHGQQLLFHHGDYVHEVRFCNKVIAAYPKLDGIMEFENLPPNHIENISYNWLYDIEETKPENYPLKPMEYGFICGYNQAKSETNFSLEDIKKAIRFGEMSTKDSSIKLFDKKGLVLTEVTEKFIESLTKQKQYEFIVETEDIFTQNSEQYIHNSGSVGNYSTVTKKPKVINNKIQGSWKLIQNT